MENDGLITGHKPPYRNLPWIWTLPKVRVLTQYFNLQHELDCADLFVKYFAGITDWDNGWTDGEYEEYRVKDLGVHYDRRMVYKGRTYLWEVDRGTEPLGVEPQKIKGKIDFFRDGDKKTLREKIANYMRFSRVHSYRFTVLFTVQDWRYGGYDEERTEQRVIDLHRMLKDADGKNHFLVADHRELLLDPQGKHFLYYKYPDLLSLEDLSDLP